MKRIVIMLGLLLMAGASEAQLTPKGGGTPQQKMLEQHINELAAFRASMDALEKAIRNRHQARTDAIFTTLLLDMKREVEQCKKAFDQQEEILLVSTEGFDLSRENNSRQSNLITQVHKKQYEKQLAVYQAILKLQDDKDVSIRKVRIRLHLFDAFADNMQAEIMFLQQQMR